MSTEPDKDVELLSLFIKGAMALHPNLDPDGDALAALASLESRISSRCEPSSTRTGRLTNTSAPTYLPKPSAQETDPE